MSRGGGWWKGFDELGRLMGEGWWVDGEKGQVGG